MKYFKRSHIVISVIMMLAVVGIQCGLNIFPDSEDVKLGQQLDAEIRNNSGEYPILQNRPDVKEYVTSIGNKILMSPSITKRNIFAYTFEIIKNDTVVNAFATPGGYVYIYTGLMRYIDNEATLAGVVAHEIAHAELRHATQRMTKAYGVQILLSMVLGENPSKIVEIGSNLLTGLAFLANSRSDEYEADEYSLKYLASTEYYPGAIVDFFNKMQAQRGGANGGVLETMLSTHPLDKDRIAAVNKNLASMGNPVASETNMFATRYQTFKSKLP
jgi:predicted Zn-dependent protease